MKNISIATWLKLKGCLVMVGICTRKDKQIPLVLSCNSHEYCRLFCRQNKVELDLLIEIVY